MPSSATTLVMTAHACLALVKIKQNLEDNAPLYAVLTYVSDAAATLFKNRYQFHEMHISECRETK